MSTPDLISESQTIRLNCLVLGDDPNEIFQVEIALTASVSVLKDLIKEKKKPQFDHIPAGSLKLWNVDLPVDDALDRNIRCDIDQKLPLSPVVKLLKLFSKLPEEEHLHIVIQGPPLASSGPLHLKLNCLVLGDDPSRVFPVDIAQTQTIGDLKKAIKEEKRPEFDAIAADGLKLWNVDLPVDDALDRNIRRDIDQKLPLSPVAELQDFSSPQRKRLHIVIQRPAAGSSFNLLRLSPSERRVQECRETYANEFPSDAPSSQGIPSKFNHTLQNKKQHTICWERPRSAAHTIPTTLLHPIFGQFIDDCENHEPTKEDNDLVMALSVAMCEFFEDEKERGSKFREILREHHIDLISSKIDYSNYETDGDIQYRGFRYAILEAKNELGSTKAEPHMQSILYYIQSTKSLVRKNPGFRFPCMLITLFGPHIDFSGVVWTTRPNVQVLSTALPLFYHHTDTRMCATVARHIGAFRKALRSLKEYCEEMDLRTSSPTIDMDLVEFPFRCYYTCIETSSTLHFRYICQLDQTKLVFRAQTTDKRTILVKFVRRYSIEVHKFCASQDFAPALYGFDHLPGGWYMVAMELIEDYCHLRECYSHEDEIAQKLEYLHQNGLVHGDIRDTNIMVKQDGSGIKLVDFDWSGKIGEIRYPMNVYRGNRLWRPDGAEGGQLIMAEHDIQMLDAIFHAPPGGFLSS